MLITLIVLIPILFIIGTTYNAIKDQKKLEQGKLKSILEERKQKKDLALKNIKNNNN